MRALLKTIDDVVFKAEKAVITLALSAMSLTVFMDVLHRRLSDPRSKLGDWLLALSGGAGDSAAEATMHGSVAPVVSRLLTFGLLVFALRRASRLRGKTNVFVVALALGVTIALEGLAWSMEHLESRWVYAGLIIGLGVPIARGAKQHAKTVWVGLAICLLGTSYVPQGYSWAQNFSLFLLLWVGFLGASVATRARRHIQIDAVRKSVPEHLLGWYNAASLAVTGLFAAFLAVIGYGYTFGAQGNVHLTADIGRIPDWLVTASIPVAFLIMTLRFAAHVWQEIEAARAGKPSPMGRHDGATH